MPLTSKDIEEIEREPFKEPPFTKFFVAVLGTLAEIPLIKKYVSESIGGLSGRIFRCWEKQEYEKATQIAIYALEKYRNNKSKFLPFMDHQHWWNFMKLGMDSAKCIENDSLREKLIEYANVGIEPFEGYDVAYSYLKIARWKCCANSYEKAIEYAEVALKADSSWAEPNFMLGLNWLLLNTGNAEAHFDWAVEKDLGMLSRIENDEMCMQYPHIINKLKLKYSIQVSHPDLESG